MAAPEALLSVSEALLGLAMSEEAKHFENQCHSPGMVCTADHEEVVMGTCLKTAPTVSPLLLKLYCYADVLVASKR